MLREDRAVEGAGARLRHGEGRAQCAHYSRVAVTVRARAVGSACRPAAAPRSRRARDRGAHVARAALACPRLLRGRAREARPAMSVLLLQLHLLLVLELVLLRAVRRPGGRAKLQIGLILRHASLSATGVDPLLVALLLLRLVLPCIAG